MKPLLLILALAGSVSAQTVCPSAPNKATVYFYRVRESNAMRKGETGITLNGVRLFQMPKATYVVFQLPPARYDLTMGHDETDFPLNAESGKKYFFRVSNTAAGFSQLQVLTQVNETQATHQIKRLKPLEDGNVKSRRKERCDSGDP